ncbi:MAG: hypothetical protein KGQ79_04875 [Proteobacteria bacterium]|nr:hypothetical protein [Pseudomonadota bacterium]MBU6425455.1 hypothetical protein [Rhodospirillales bacterium]
MALLALSDGAVIGGFIGQALAAAAAQSPLFAPYVNWLDASAFVAPAFVIGAVLGFQYAFFSARAALWCRLARFVVCAHVFLLVLALLDLAVFGKAALNFLFLALPFSILSAFTLRFVWRGAKRAAENFPPPPHLALWARDAAAILAWPLCATIDYLALVPLFAVGRSDSVDGFAGLVTLGVWSTLVFLLVVVSTHIALTRRNRPVLNAVIFACIGALHLLLTAFYAAVVFKLTLGSYEFSASAPLVPVYRIILLVLVIAMPLAILLFRGIRPQYRQKQG